MPTRLLPPPIKISWLQVSSCVSILGQRSISSDSKRWEACSRPPLSPFINCTESGADDKHVSQVLQVLPVDPLICLRPATCASGQNWQVSVFGLQLMNMFMYMDLHNEALSPQHSSHLNGSECWGKGRWKPFMSASWRCESYRDISSNVKLWIWCRRWRSILCGLMSVQNFTAIHQSKKWDILTLNQVLHQPGIRFTRALNLAPPAGTEKTNRSYLNISMYVCACECLSCVDQNFEKLLLLCYSPVRTFWLSYNAFYKFAAQGFTECPH